MQDLDTRLEIILSETDLEESQKGVQVLTVMKRYDWMSEANSGKRVFLWLAITNYSLVRFWDSR